MAKNYQIKEFFKKKKKKNRKKGETLDKVMEACAEVIFAWDEFQDIWSDGMKDLGNLCVDIGAAIVNGTDYALAGIDRGIFFVSYHFAKAMHNFLEECRIHRRVIARDLAAFLLIAVGLIALLNYATGYEYSYKGNALGVVNNQEDVLQIVDLVSENLSMEYDTKIDIDPTEDISFERTFTLNREIDDMDKVLERLSNMSDTQAESYAIVINGKAEYYLEDKESANKILQKIINYYVPVKKQAKYESIQFVQDVKVEKIDTIVGNIRSMKSVYKSILKGKKGEGHYTIKQGDTVSGICSKLGISMSKLKQMNPKLKPDIIHAGQKLVVSKAVPKLSVKTTGIETYQKKIRYKVIYKNSSRIYSGDTEVSRPGTLGIKSITSKVVRKNGKKIKEKVISSKVIRKPVSKIILKGTKKRPPTIGSGNFAWPVHGANITSYFGYRWGRLHEGLDLACSTGTPIYASDGGTVITAGWHWGYGLCIIIDHQNGFKTLYGHCSSLSVSVGDKVYRGKYIGAVGNTGNSYGSHCHFEIIKNGSSVDPLSYL